MLGAVGGGVGSALCALALVRGSFGLFLLGSLLSGLYMSAQGFYRFAATDGASEDFRAEGDLLRHGGGARLGGRRAAAGAADRRRAGAGALRRAPIVAAAALNVVGVWLFAFLDSPRPRPPAAGRARGRGRGWSCCARRGSRWR